MAFPNLIFVLLSLYIRMNLATYPPKARAVFGPSTGKYVVDKLPNITYNLPPSWAGQINIPGTKNDELFFWLFETENQSQSDDLIIWLNGGPGCSSLEGVTIENGPLAFYGNATYPAYNPYSWTKLANVLYIDQPVGTGYSSGSDQATNNTEVTQDFYKWLVAFYAKFPALKSKKTHLMGESYAGIYIPYFAHAILDNRKELSINLKSITLGDPAFGNGAAMTDVPVNTYIHQNNHTLDIPQDILAVFADADKNCGFTNVINELTYPPQGKLIIAGDPEGNNYFDFIQNKESITYTCNQLLHPLTPTEVSLSIYSACFGPCATFATAANYLTTRNPCFSLYNIEYTCENDPTGAIAPSNYLNLPSVRAAIHAPNKTIIACNNTVQGVLAQEDVEPPAYSIIPSILEQDIGVHIYSGERDFLLDHIGTELVIQNMTWCGKQGFQSSPKNPFKVNGEVAGNWGYERGLSYHHTFQSGHLFPHDRPAAAFAFVRDFVIGTAGYIREG